MAEKNIFQIAAKGKYRFPFRGTVMTEDLYDLTVEHLDTVFKSLNAELKQTEEVSLLGSKTASESVLINKIEIVKFIVSEKLEEAKARLQANEKKAQKHKIMEILSQKKDQSLQGKTEEELEKMLNDLTD